MTARLLNAPFAVQRAVAWGALALLLTVAATNIFGLGAGIAERYGTLIETREKVGRLSRFVAVDLSTLPEPSHSADVVNLFMDAPSLAIARANLQQRVTEIAAVNTVLIASAGNVPDLTENDATLIGLRVEFSGGYENVAKMVMALEASSPPLILKELNVHALGEDLPDRPPELAAQLRLYSAVRADQAAAGEGSPAK